MLIIFILWFAFGWLIAEKFTEDNRVYGFGGFVFKSILAILWPISALLIIFG